MLWFLLDIKREKKEGTYIVVKRVTIGNASTLVNVCV